MLATMAVFMLGTATIAAIFPRIFAWPVALFAAWFGLAWGVKAWRVWHGRSRPPLTPEMRGERDEPGPAGEKEN
jgi:hypothetical protein